MSHSISGRVASVGVAEGTAVVVIKQTPQVTNIEQPYVVVADITTPDLVPILIDAAAIVTDIGGLASHAAAIARELGIPCIVSTQYASVQINTGDRVTVDAERNEVKWTPHPTQCVLCTKHELLHLVKTQHLVAIPDGFPIRAGHSLVFPCRHVTRFGDLSAYEISELREVILELQEIFKIKFGATAMNIGLNDGEAAGQTISHLHFHVIPRRPGDTINPRGGIRNFLADHLSSYP